MGLVGLGLAATAFPQCLGSPYANLSAEVRYWFEVVVETQSLLETFHHKPGFAVSILILPLAALVLLVVRPPATALAAPRWITLLGLVLSGLAVMSWQIRGAAYAGLVASLALIPFADIMSERADRRALANARQLFIRLGLRLCVPGTCILAVVLPLLFSPSASGLAADTQEDECAVAMRPNHPVLTALNDPAGLGAEARTIAAPIDLGPAVLLLTQHRVLAAPYHRNIQGLIDNRRIFAGTEDAALATVRARNVEAILFCRKFVPVTTQADQPAFLNERLSAGRPPWWLAPMTRNEDVGLYRVHSALRAVH